MELFLLMSPLKIATPEAMEEFGREFAARLAPGSIVKITGPLGAGKTTLVRGVVAGLGGNPEAVHSPTFSLVHDYASPSFSIKHCDFYRLPENSELEEFGGLEFFDSDSIYLIEWPERFRLWGSITSDRLLEADLQHDAGGRVVRLLP
jgi:tRNA threonylcarbamoyladenosine biosynthesis protein TsaE